MSEKDKMNEVIIELREYGQIMYNSDDFDKLIYVVKDKKSELGLNEYLADPKKYTPDHTRVNTFMILMEHVNNRNKEYINKITDSNILMSSDYDACISHLLESKSEDMEIIEILYEQISLESREFLLTSFLMSSDEKIVLDWVFGRFDAEPYIELQKIVAMIIDMNVPIKCYEQLLKYVIVKDELDTLLNEMFYFGFDNTGNSIEKAKLFIKECGNEKLTQISQDYITGTLVNVGLSENNELMDLLLENIKVTNEMAYSWILILMKINKIDPIRNILEKTKLILSKKHIDHCIFSLKDEMTIEKLRFLKSIEKYMEEPIDFTSNEYVLLREAIINEKKDMVEYIIENIDCSKLKEDELLVDTIEFFASEEIQELLQQYLE